MDPPEARLGLLEDGLHIGFPGHVGRDEQGVDMAETPDLGLRRLALIVAEARQHHIGARQGEGHGRRSPDPAGGAEHQRRLS